MNKLLNPSKVVQISLGIFVLLMGYLLISSLTYKPEDLSGQEPIRSFTFNLCEKYPSQEDFFRGTKTTIYTNPQETGITGYVEPCLGWTAEVYQEEMYEGDKWLLMIIGDVQGWQKQEVME